MKISLEWLRDYLPGELDATAAGEALTNGGLPVEVIERHGEDTVIDVEVTSNRGDCLCHVGVGRELSALLSREFKDVRPAAREGTVPASSVVSVRIDTPDLCPHYTARILRGVKVRPSPRWLARRLEAVGVRPINNIVDVTNYVMFEMGQPLHAFDLSKVGGPAIVVRRAKQGEKLLSLDGKERALTTTMLVIADASRAIALAGVMGGEETEITDSTVDVLLESARFDPLSVRRTTRALSMEKTDSSYRFERGIDPTLPERASLRAAQLILETAGGELLQGVVQAGAAHFLPKTLSLRLAKLRQVLGIDVPPNEAVEALRRLQLEPRLVGDKIDVTVPSFRSDINIEVDLVEEVARLIGYDRIPTRQEIAIRLTPPDPAQRAMEQIRSLLVGAGYFEAITVTFVSDLLAADFKPPEAAALPRADAAVRKDNAHLRPSVLPGLLESVGRNENAGTMGARLFETGSVFWTDGAGKIIEQRRLGIAGPTDLREVRGVVEELLNQLDAEKSVAIHPDTRPGFGAAACGRIEWGGKTIGYLGKIARGVIDKLSLRESPGAAELDLPALVAGAQHVPQLRPLPKYPPMRRDLSLVLPESMRYEQLESLIRALEPAGLEDLEYVTTYRGKPLDKGLKSVTVTLIFRSSEGTLTSEQVEAPVAAIIAAAREKLGATLRA